MPIYRYSAIDRGGNMLSATMVAGDTSAAASSLIARGLSPVTIVEDESGGTSFADLLRRIGVVRLREVVLFLRMMGALINSGITITESIAVLHEQMLNRKFKHILGEVKMQIEGGVALSDALARYPRIFPETAVNMIRAGEMGGILEGILENLVIYMEKRAALKKMLLRSLMYPAIVLVVAIGVVVFLVTFVIPRFTLLLQGSKLPWNTQFLLDLSAVLIGNGREIVMAVLGSLALLAILFMVRETRLYIDRYMIHVPVIGPILRLGIIVQFARTLGALLTSGITLVEALTATRDTIGNQAAKRAIDQALEKVVAGEQLSGVLGDSRMFTNLMMSMIRIGEQSGNMDKQVMLVAEIHEQQMEDRISWHSGMVEPALILGLGGVVGFVAWALVAGMLAMYRT
jgi:type IV pilus assembly protein PilC